MDAPYRMLRIILDSSVSIAAQPPTIIAVPSALKKFMPSLHLEKLREAKEGKIDFVMIGDSITHSGVSTRRLLQEAMP